VWETSGIRRWPEHVVNLNAYGANGTALADTETNAITAWLDPGLDGQMGPTIMPFVAPGGHPVREQLRDIVDRLRAGRPPLVDVVHGAKTIATLAAGLRVGATRRPERVPPVE